MNSESRTPIRTYRRIHLTVEAMRYTDATRDAVIAWVGKDCQHSAIDDDGAPYELANLRIYTANGSVRADKGDWVVKDADGGFYPCTHSVFEKVYGPDDGTAQSETRTTEYICPKCGLRVDPHHCGDRHDW